MPVQIDKVSFRALLDLFMCCDPWPVTAKRTAENAYKGPQIDQDNHAQVEAFMNQQSKLYGFPSYVEAFHRLKI